MRVDAAPAPLFGGDSLLFRALAILASKESPVPAAADLLRSRGGGGDGEADRDPPDAERLRRRLDERSLERERDRALRILDRGGGDDRIANLALKF